MHRNILENTIRDVLRSSSKVLKRTSLHACMLVCVWVRECAYSQQILPFKKIWTIRLLLLFGGEQHLISLQKAKPTNKYLDTSSCYVRSNQRLNITHTHTHEWVRYIRVLDVCCMFDIVSKLQNIFIVWRLQREKSIQMDKTKRKRIK